LTGAPHNPEKRVQQVFGLENFTEADLEAIHVAEAFAKFHALLDAPPSDNPKLRALMATKAPWET
jgi:Protein of unknown function (DUF1778)